MIRITRNFSLKKIFGSRLVFFIILLAIAFQVWGCISDTDEVIDSQSSISEQTVIINEVLANEPQKDSDAEFVEIVNTSNQPIDISRWTISDSASIRHIFYAPTILDKGKALVVFADSSAIPPELTNAVASSKGTLGLSNTKDTVYLRNAKGLTIDSVTYNSSLASSDGVSMNREQDGESTPAHWVLHSTISSLSSSPGKRVDGSEFDDNTGLDQGIKIDAGQIADLLRPDQQITTVDASSDQSSSGLLAHLRVVAANLTSGNGQSYDEGSGIRILQGLKPDIVLIQEFRYKTNSTTDIRGFVDITFGSSFYYYRESGGGIPNGVISRYPIKNAGSWDDPKLSDREFVWAQIDIPGPKDLWAISLHLHTGNAAGRGVEAQSLVRYIKQYLPSDDYLVIGGDFNTSSRGESCINTLSEVVVTARPYPVDQRDNANTNSSRGKPYDWVISNTILNSLQVPTHVAGTSYSAGLVFDSRVFTPLNQIPPVKYSDSDATAMQHMAVVKDYEVPQ